ncbi:unnamed protein product [Allacma fusca]|uniref:Mitochondrial thiamine pyrophosphate carrier n=1 Tax=Allacma fusca TaxID=39272 RepID=A0A8J2M8W1_9HEXA|nr:unnamed protein product [Allacma fusca]
MVGYDEEQKQLSEIWHGMAGVLSGMATRFLCQPFDVFKIRFQLQHEPLKPSQHNYYWGLMQALKRILSEESYRALWKGHVPAQLLSGVYGLVQFGSFEYLTRYMHSYLINEETVSRKAVIHFVSGSVSGALATAFSFPFDTVRTRLVGQAEPKVYRGVYHAFQSMIRYEGILSVYKGLIPALLQIMPHTGVQFASFHLFSNLASNFKNQDKNSRKAFWHNLLCGSGAGLISKLAVYPLDLTKKRLQVQGFEEARMRFGKVQKYTGTFQCLKHVATHEGVSGLYKGVYPSLLKAVVSSGLMFGTYEEVLRYFREYSP